MANTPGSDPEVMGWKGGDFRIFAKIRKNRKNPEKSDSGDLWLDLRLRPGLRVGLDPRLRVRLRVGLRPGLVPAPARQVDRVSEAVFLGFRSFQ